MCAGVCVCVVTLTTRVLMDDSASHLEIIREALGSLWGEARAGNRSKR